jgi:hypothetical protein
MAKTTCKIFKVKLTAAQQKITNSNVIDMSQHAALCKSYAWCIAKVELQGTLPEVLHLKALPSLL